MEKRAFSNASGRANAQQPRQTMSCISTFKRDWTDDDPGQSQDTVFSWPDSPGRTNTKPDNSSSNQPTVKQVSASEKRLAAIRAALEDNSAPSQASSSSTIRVTSTSSVTSSSSSTKRSAPESSAEPPSKKRQLPWEASHSALRANHNQKFKTSTFAASSSTTATSETRTTTSSTGHISVASKILLSSEQQHVLNMIMEGKNVFFTGSAGTGKSVLLREVIRNLRLKYSKSPDAVAITASTGIAACNIGGVTLHSFSGAGLAKEPAEQLASRIRRNKKSSTRWVRTVVLILDEVSMVDGELFDKLEKIARLMRKSTRPFGGIQLVLTGDFFQLPPVSKGPSAKFAFEAESWTSCIDVTFNLTQVFRQKDQDFVDMLNEMRFGQLSAKSIQKFRSLSKPIDYEGGIEPTELFPRREDVDRANEFRNSQLTGEAHCYDAIDGGILSDENQRKNLLSNFMAQGKLELRVDAQVMLIKNTDETLVNGSMGKVIGFYDPNTFRQNPNTGAVEVVEEQFDLSTTAGRKAHQRKQRQLAEDTVTKFPLVRFVVPGVSGRHRDVLVAPDVFKVELPTGEVQVSRTQFPLVLAWALSIHKSQGQTIDRVKVDLRKVFEKGQAYVALSRATSLEGLQVLGFDPSKVLAHPKVIAWNKNLTTFT